MISYWLLVVFQARIMPAWNTSLAQIERILKRHTALKDNSTAVNGESGNKGKVNDQEAENDG